MPNFMASPLVQAGFAGFAFALLSALVTVLVLAARERKALIAQIVKLSESATEAINKNTEVLTKISVRDETESVEVAKTGDKVSSIADFIAAYKRTGEHTDEIYRR